MTAGADTCPKCNRRHYECAGTTPADDRCPVFGDLCPDFLLLEAAQKTAVGVDCVMLCKRTPCQLPNGFMFPDCNVKHGDSPGLTLAREVPCR